MLHRLILMGEHNCASFLFGVSNDVGCTERTSANVPAGFMALGTCVMKCAVRIFPGSLAQAPTRHGSSCGAGR